MSGFEKKVAVITGAASGLGRATALAYASEGASVALLDVDEAGLTSTEEEARSLGTAAVRVPCDISNPAACRGAIEKTVAALGGIDILVNAAGITQFSHARDLSPQQWRRTFGVNLDGPFFLYQAAIHHLLERGGSILNVASSAALVGEAYLTDYAASKAGLVHLTRSLAMEHMHDRVRINAIAPGAMDTPMATKVTFPDDVKGELITRYTGQRTPSTPEEVAQFILYVTSDAAPSIHGACLSIDGGIAAG